MIHIANAKSLMTKCGKPVARRWWVSDARVEYGLGPGKLLVRREIPRQEIVRASSCTDCVKRFRRN